MTEHRHAWHIADTQPAPEGINGRTITMGCTTCDETRKTVTLKTDAEIQTELDAYNASEDDAS